MNFKTGNRRYYKNTRHKHSTFTNSIFIAILILPNFNMTFKTHIKFASYKTFKKVVLNEFLRKP